MDYDKILSRRAVAIKPSGIRRFFDLSLIHISEPTRH